MSTTGEKKYKERINLFSKVNRTAVSFNNANPKSKKMTPIDLNDDEVINFFRSLQQRDAKYLLVGGVAMAFHGYVRATHDLDLWIKDNPQNIEKLKLVFKEHGVTGIDQTRDLDFVAGFTEFRIGNSDFVVDPMKNLKSFSQFDFDQCYNRAEAGEYNGVKFKVIEAQDLLKEKRSTNMPKDQGDIEYLESLPENPE